MTSHARFEPLPAEKRVPKPAEEPGQAWQALEGSGVERDDDIAAVEWWDDDEEAGEDDEVTTSNFEFDSLDQAGVEFDSPEQTTSVVESLSSSMETDSGGCEDDGLTSFIGVSPHVFFSRKSRLKQPAAVYSGPQLCLDDDNFDD